MTSKTMAALEKRRKWPVKLGEDSVFIRAMIKREQRESLEVKIDPGTLAGMTSEEKQKAESDINELRGYFIFGVVLIEADGSPTFERATGESPIDFARRVEESMAEVPEDNKLAILQELTKAHTTPSVEKISKN